MGSSGSYPSSRIASRSMSSIAGLDAQGRAPNATFRVANRLGPKLKVVDADRNRVCLVVEFIDDKGDSVITGTRDRLNSLLIDNAQPSDLSVTTRFMDAGGRHWLRSPDSVKLAK
jgi:hypothetical protein